MRFLGFVFALLELTFGFLLGLLLLLELLLYMEQMLWYIVKDGDVVLVLVDVVKSA